MLPTPQVTRSHERPQRSGVPRGRRRTGTRVHPFPLTLGLLSTAVGLFFLVLGALPELQARHRLLAQAASFIPYGTLAWVAAVMLLLLALRGRVRALPLLAVAGLVAQAVWLRPYLPIPATGTPNLIVMSINVEFGEGDLTQLLQIARRERVDVISVQEVTPEAEQQLTSGAWARLMPHRLGSGENGATGTMLLSRHRLTPLVSKTTIFAQHLARVELPGRSVVVAAIHTINPMARVSSWTSDAMALRTMLAPHTNGPLVVAGDFNAVNEHLTLQRIQADDLTDAAAAAGAGWRPTFPADRWHPPLIAIDHVLISRQVKATRLDTFHVAGTDHLGLVAGLLV